MLVIGFFASIATAVALLALAAVVASIALAVHASIVIGATDTVVAGASVGLERPARSVQCWVADLASVGWVSLSGVPATVINLAAHKRLNACLGFCIA